MLFDAQGLREHERGRRGARGLHSQAHALSLLHSSTFGSGISYEGKRAIVFGTGNSGHDVAQDLHANGAAEVTMIQRSPTCVVSLVPSGTMVYALYSEGPPNDDIDLITAAIPYPVLRETYQWLTKRTCALALAQSQRMAPQAAQVPVS